MVIVHHSPQVIQVYHLDSLNGCPAALNRAVGHWWQKLYSEETGHTPGIQTHTVPMPSQGGNTLNCGIFVTEYICRTDSIPWASISPASWTSAARTLQLLQATMRDVTLDYTDKCRRTNRHNLAFWQDRPPPDASGSHSPRQGVG